MSTRSGAPVSQTAKLPKSLRTSRSTYSPTTSITPQELKSTSRKSLCGTALESFTQLAEFHGGGTMMAEMIVPSFTEERALAKVRVAEELWNTRDPERVALAYTEDSEWRNRVEFLKGREEIKSFRRRKWANERGYKLKKTLWGFRGNRVAVSFEYEWHDDSNQWFRSYGIELWEFDDGGLMRRRLASINDVEITEKDRRVGV